MHRDLSEGTPHRIVNKKAAARECVAPLIARGTIQRDKVAPGLAAAIVGTRYFVCGIHA